MSATAGTAVVARATAARRRARRGGVPLVVGAVIVALATAWAIASLRAHADERREAQVRLEALQAGVAHHAALVWEGLAGGMSAGIRQELGAVRAGVNDQIQALTLVDPGGRELMELLTAYADYELAAAQLVGAARPGVTPDRLDLQAGAVRDAEAALAGRAAAVAGTYLATARATSTAADLGTTTTLVSSAVLLALLFRRSERANRIAAILAHERRVIQRSERRFRALVQRSSDMTTVLDAGGTVRYQSPSGERLLGVPASQVMGRSWADLLHPDDGPAAVGLLETARQGTSRAEAIQWRIRRGDGSWLEVETFATNLLEEDTVRGVVLNSRDVTERSELQRRLFHQAYHDPLTGLPNLASFREALREAVARSRRRGAPVAVLLLDLDLFKHVNDSMGHAAGDELLIGVAERLQASLRDGDVAARLAGDEFAVVLEDAGGPEDAARLAERVADALRRPFQIHGQQVFTAASIGIVCRAEDVDAEQLLRDADVAMYRAKMDGQRRYAVFEPAMHAAAVERLQLETDLRAALGTEQLAVAYQPIFRLADGLPVAVEALARWRHPTLGQVPPTRFIPIAEETGLIGEVGWWVVDTAARQLAAWRAADDRLGDLVMSVNISARQLMDPDLPPRLAALVEELGLPPAALMLELTEGAAAAQAAGIPELAALRAVGLRLAIDDFGTGQSTLARLRQLPVDTVKIDRSFVQELEDGANVSLLRAMVELSRSLNLATVAEGVETDTQRRLLLEIGCDAAQGYLLARPSEPQSAAAMIGAALRDRRVPRTGVPLHARPIRPGLVR
ncbi:MAG: putative bifunctional diguanylate cyclase/phosphodiesterase [Candidatus Limnocylindria bacterium]